MSSGGPFTQVVNNKTFDKLLTNADLLEKRLKNIKCKKLRLAQICEIEKTHMFFPNPRYKPFVQMTHEYFKAKSQGTPNFGSTPAFQISQFGDFISDMVLHVKFKALGDPNAELLDGGTRYKYCDYPGMKLLKCVNFGANGNPIAYYDRNDVIMYNQFKIPENKRASWDKAMGQDRGVETELYQVDYETTRCSTIKYGAQTAKQYQKPLDGRLYT